MSMQGHLKLEFASRDGVTEIVDRLQTAPLHVQKGPPPRLDLSGMAWVYVVSTSGGDRPGDRLQPESSQGTARRFI